MTSAVSYRYAIALMDLAEAAKKLDKVESDLKELMAMISNSPDLSILVRSPLVNAKERAQALQVIAEKAKFQDLTKNFLGVLSKNGRLSALEGIVGAFGAELARRRGEITVNVQVAQDMTAEQEKSLQAAISKAIGSEVTIRAKVEPGILGGMIVTVGSQMIDDSVARKLERLKTAMSRQSNENLSTKVKEA